MRTFLGTILIVAVVVTVITDGATMAVAETSPQVAATAATPAAAATDALDAAAPGNEAGIPVAGSFAGVCAAADGTLYLLGIDHRLLKISPDGQQQTIVLPPVADRKEDEHFCDLAVSDRGLLAFCGFAFSGIYLFDPNQPDKLDFVKIVGPDAEPVNILSIAVNGDAWNIRDAEERVFQVGSDGIVKQFPQHAALLTDQAGKAVIVPPPHDEGDKIVYPGKVLREDGKPFWTAPAPVAPRNIISVDYLGYDPQQRDVFVTTAASGERDSANTLYAVKDNEVVAVREIPQPSALGVIRYCRLAPDGSLLLLLADPNEANGVLLKRISLITTLPGAG